MSAHIHHAGTAAAKTDMDMSDRCSMNMLFTWNTENLCVVFRWWHVRSTFGLLLTLGAIVAFAAGYEALREGIRVYEARVARQAEIVPRQAQATIERRAHIIKAVLYGLQNFYAFMIMLIFMTYNGWVMIAASVGAAVGYLLFGGSLPAAKDTACH